MQFNHIEGVTAKATFSGCGEYRYILEIINNSSEGNKSICVIMQNPSKANSEIADKSVQFLEKLIFNKSYTEFEDVKKIIIVNQFSYVQTNNFIGSEENIGEDNDKYINEAIHSSEIILIAWGSSNRYTERKNAINNIIFNYNSKKLLQTKAHPSRGTYIDFVEPYII